MHPVSETGATFEAALSAQRARLVRLCAHLTGDAEAAEDLAQETLLESWRLVHKLRSQGQLAPWLSAIARNVCLRWARSRSRELAWRIRVIPDDERLSPLSLEEWLPDETDLELVLERHELAELLDRALGLLPRETRQILIASYIHELPQAELAARLGLSEGTLRVRLHRGKLALRQVLTNDLSQEAMVYGLTLPDTGGWQETRIWCPFCGKYRLLCRIDQHQGCISFRCSGSCIWPTGEIVTSYCSRLGQEFTSMKALLSRLLLSCHVAYRQGLAANQATCRTCGRPALIVREPYHLFQAPEPLRTCYVLHLQCATCGMFPEASLMHLTLDLPETQRFWRAHPRLQIFPDREIEFAGRPAIQTRLQSVTDQARLEVIAARDTFEVLCVQEGTRGV